MNEHITNADQGWHLTRIVREIFSQTLQKGADMLIFQPHQGHYATILQKDSCLEIRSFKMMEEPNTALSIVHYLGTLVDSRKRPKEFVRQGKFKIELIGRNWSVEVVSIPQFFNADLSNKPIVTVFFTEIT